MIVVSRSTGMFMRRGGNSIRCLSPAVNTYELAMDEVMFDVLGKMGIRMTAEFEAGSVMLFILLQKSLLVETWLLMKFSFSILIELLVA